MSESGHEAGVLSLTTLAGLFGCSTGIVFSDATRPDVLMCDPSRLLLFVGEAKATERASDARAVARLRAYVVWIRAHLASHERCAILSLSVARADDLPDWRDVVVDLALENGLPTPIVRSAQVDAATSFLVLWWSSSAVFVAS